MAFEQDVPTAENELVIEKKGWFGKCIRFEIKATSAALPSILRICDRHLGKAVKSSPLEKVEEEEE